MKKAIGLLVALAFFAASALAQTESAIPAGTAIRMKLDRAISTATAVPGEAFSGKVSEAVVVDGRTLIPAGATLEGRILRVSEPRGIAGRPSIRLRPDQVTFPSGNKMQISATVVDTDRPHQLAVDDEGRIKGARRSGTDNVELAAGTGVGTIAGTIIGGGRGALIGALAGATATTAHWLAARHSAELPEGMEIIFELNRPAAMSAKTAEARGGE